jgi:DNA-directed RNA polymerase subunit RPC12/RpoP
VNDEIKKAIKATERRIIRWKVTSNSRTYPQYDELIKIDELVFQALREKAERDNECEYCNGIVKGELVGGETIRELEIRQQIKSGNYCPMCGRKLEPTEREGGEN